MEEFFTVHTDSILICNEQNYFINLKFSITANPLVSVTVNISFIAYLFSFVRRELFFRNFVDDFYICKVD